MNNLKFKEKVDMDFVAIGRAAVDLNPNEINRPMEESATFTKYLGGSPANITVAMAALGMETGFIGRVADDPLGRFVINYLKSRNIDTSNVVVDKSGAKTGLAFLEVKSPEDCNITMYRDNVVDLKVEVNDINEEYIKNAKALLISGTALADSPSREAVFACLEFARKHNTMVFFDIDYRPYTWKSAEETSIYYNLAAEKCDVIIGTREEFDMMEMLTNPKNKDDYVTAKKWFNFNAKIVVIKHGKKGSIAYTKEGGVITGAVFPVMPVKTFGAGDSYAGAFIYGLMNGLSIEESMELGAASAAIVVSSHSCSDAMPTLDEIRDFIKNYGK
ncbi:2-deoxy-5-keto-D-gluconic acid kinase [[Clostridium] ultunense Esp]|uniref:5-dehydro-2-deoxygluconokinase n=1 Tax=[Clostridium] ultunense Esp TaxID=1288971 RepID=M1Z402_9FIRM|nr:5-dehydro-2-deoxygluconokinase [Schnuerera ultunensis]CCQ97630.1 2-deoxy-5-keto-D-gluconic acid kinase [[Clostridium] ultunense Esp]SHD75758.1 2-deoxy-5-keto-D-gluconic acid kinase [[Clostridium] ultunense Esp]